MKAFLISFAFATLCLLNLNICRCCVWVVWERGALGDNSWEELSKLHSVIKMNELSLCLCYWSSYSRMDSEGIDFLCPSGIEIVCFHRWHVSSVQSLSRVRLFATPWASARQASLSITNSRSLPKPMSIESVMPSNHLILCRPLLLLPSIFPSITVFSNDSALLRIMWPKYWSFSFSISPSNEHPGLISFRMDWLDLLAVQGTLKTLNTTVQKHQFFCTELSL